MNKKEWFCLISLLVIAVILRIPNLNAVSQGDETYFPHLVQYQLENGFSFKMETSEGIQYWGDLPLNGLIYTGYVYLVGYSIVKMRFLSILIAVINLSLVFIISKKLFGTGGGLFALFLMTFSYWHIFESFTIGRDGSFLMLLYLLIFYLYFKYKESNHSIYLFLISGTITIFLLIKSSGILAISMVFLLLLKDSKIIQILFTQICVEKSLDFKNAKALIFNRLQKLLINSVYLIVPVCIYFLSLLFIYESNFEMFKGMYSHAAPLSMVSLSFFSIIRVFIYLILWGSPLIFGLTLMSLLKYEERKLPFLIWIIIPIIAYSLVEYRGSVDRYLSVTIPAFCILGGAFLNAAYANNKFRRGYLVILTLVAFVSFHIISLIRVQYIPHDIKQYLINFMTLNWDFAFPFYGASQPTFMVSFLIIGSVLVLSGLLFILYLLKIKRNLILLLFLALTFSFSAAVIEECDIHTFFPDFKQVISDTKKYIEDNDLPLPIITRNHWLQLPFRNIGHSKMVLINKKSISQENIEEIKFRGGTLILIHYPNYSYEHILNSLPWCSLRKEFVYRDITMSSIYICPKLKSPVSTSIVA